MAVVLGEALVRVRPDTTGFESSVHSKLGSALKRVGGLAKAAFTGVAIAGTAAVVSSVKLEASFSKTMNTMGAVANVPQKQLRTLSDLAIKMGQDTVFSANDAAGAMLELAKNGLTPATIQSGALKSAMTLAAAGGLDMTTAAQTMGNALGVFNLRGKQSGQVAAALAGAASASSASVESLAHGLSAVGPGAHQAGLSIQETTAGLAAFEHAGIKGQDAGTSLKTFLQRLVPATTKAADAMKSYGLLTYSAQDAAKALALNGIHSLSGSYKDVTAALGKWVVSQGLAKEGTAGQTKAVNDYLVSSGALHSSFIDQKGNFKSLSDISGVLQKHLKELTPAARSAALTQIFGSDASRAAAVLMQEGSKGIDTYVKATSDQTAAQKQAAATMKGTSGALEKMKGSLSTAGLALGMAIKPLVIFGAAVVANIADRAGPIFEKLGVVIRQVLRDGPSVDQLGASIKHAFMGIDWGSLGDLVSKFFHNFSDGLKGANTRLPSLTDLLSVVGVTLGFVADHADLLAKALPFLVAGFLAYKAAQSAAHVVALASIPLQAAQTVATFRLAASNRALSASLKSSAISTQTATAAQGEQTVATNTGVLASIRARVATIAKAIAEKAAALASKSLAAAQWLINAAMTANPIGLVIVALVALGAGLVLAYQKSATFRAIVQGALHAVQAAASAVVGWFTGKFVPFFTKTIPGAFSSVVAWVKAHWPIMLAIITGPIGLATLFIVRHWADIQKAFSSAVGFCQRAVSTSFDAVQKKIGSVIVAVTRILRGGGDFVRTTFVNAFRTGVNLIGDIWEGLKKLAAAPVNFVINTVYNNGLRKMLNLIPGVNLAEASPVKFAKGGVMPGWSPGRDIHKFYSPTGGALELSGGEGFVTPKLTQLLGGKRGLAEMERKAARFASGGVWRPIGLGAPITQGLHDAYTGYPALDYGHAPGYPVAAVAPGRVSLSADLVGNEPRNAVQNGYYSYGRYMKVIHDGFETLYAHLSKRGLGAGSIVDAGTTLGLSGNTGHVIGSGHLHHGVKGRSPYDFAGGRTDYHAGSNLGKFLGSVQGIGLPSIPDWLTSIPGKIDGLLRAVGGMGGRFGPWGSVVAGGATSGLNSAKDFVLEKIKGFASSVVGTVGAGLGALTGPVNGAQAAQSWARSNLPSYGWGPEQFQPLLQLWTGESGWNYKAENSSSGAYGIPQALPPEKMAQFGADWRSNAVTQMRWGLGYIRDVYGSPGSAFSTWAARRPHWYDDGGLARGTGLMQKRIVAPERVLSPRQTDLHDRQTLALERLAAGSGGSPGRYRIELDIGGGKTLTGWMRQVARQESAADGQSTRFITELRGGT